MSVTIVIPNHDEPMIDETVARLRTLSCPIVVANDPDGRGIGWAIREGLKEVETEWVLFAMADGSEEVECLRTMIRRADMTVAAVFGDRWTLGHVIGYPLWKRILNRLGNHLIARVVRFPYVDWTDLAKAYHTRLLRQITWSDDFRCAVEIPVRYVRYFSPAALFSVPMTWRERTAGRSSYRLHHAIGCLRALWTVTLYG